MSAVSRIYRQYAGLDEAVEAEAVGAEPEVVVEPEPEPELETEDDTPED